ncbi:hypothetical protein ACFSTE_13345 [Aquimarina hainanensis]|uniref:Uncharacterized protein n=1 Tax=Aquimarina hainanensis TaxID=1578017 RepID=A0ABW5N9J2_9FLAO
MKTENIFAALAIAIFAWFLDHLTIIGGVVAFLVGVSSLVLNILRISSEIKKKRELKCKKQPKEY